ncbi:MAG: hypothetical protein ABR523_06840, partial [Desulfurivibrionaceae bacterium]
MDTDFWLLDSCAIQHEKIVKTPLLSGINQTQKVELSLCGLGQFHIQFFFVGGDFTKDRGHRRK